MLPRWRQLEWGRTVDARPYMLVNQAYENVEADQRAGPGTLSIVLYPPAGWTEKAAKQGPLGTLISPRDRGSNRPQLRPGYSVRQAVPPPRIKVPQLVGSVKLRMAVVETIDCWTAVPARSLSLTERAKP